MNIALITQYFWPEQFIINYLVKELAKQGHCVFVLTGKPNYPAGEIFPGYSEKSTMKEEYIPGVEIFRSPLRPRGKKGAKNLFMNYLSFVVNGVKYYPDAIKDKKFDVILVFGMSPITSVIPAIKLKKITKAHLVVWIQDLWPESLKATGYIQSGFLLWLVKCLVRWIYSCCDTLLVQSRGFIDQLKKLANHDKIIYYPNSFVQDSKCLSDNNTIPEALLDLLKSNCCFIFSGNLGKAQALDTLLDAAKNLTDLKDFKLVIIGSGSQDNHLKKRIRDEGINQVILAGQYPMELMPQIMKYAAALIVSLAKDELFSYTVPSKIQAYLAAGRPIIAALNGEGAAIVLEAGAGLVCPAEDVDGLVACIKNVYAMPESERIAMGASGQNYFMKNFEMTSQARKLIDLLNQRLSVPL